MKKHALQEVRKLQENFSKNINEYTSHLLIGIEQNENNFPESTLISSNAKPLELIGMCTQLIENLKDIRSEAIQKLKPKNSEKKSETSDEEIKRLTDMLPKPISDKFYDIKSRMDAAIKSGDLEEMHKIQKELLEMKSPADELIDKLKKDTKDPDEFNIDDFK